MAARAHPAPSRLARLSAFALLAACGACAGPPSADGCTADADCGPGLLCHAGTCAGNVPPNAAITLPAGASTHRLLTLRSQSSDPEGRPLTLEWKVEPIDAPCEAEPEPAAGTTLDVVFWCPGDYRVTLVATDPLGAQGVAAVRVLSVQPSTGAPTVSAGPGVAASHRCEAEPPSCEAVGPGGDGAFALSAVGVDPGAGPLAWEWTHLPPAGAGPAPVAAFSPGADVASTTASITSQGGRIGGLHRFRARARNAEGLLGQALQEVVVGNELPVVAAGSFSLGHRYADGRYVVDEEIDLGVTDPDGDLLLVGAWFSTSVAAGCSEDVTPLEGSRLRVRIACATPSGLAAGASRALTISVADPNGGIASFSAPIGVVNRSPVVVLAPEWAGTLSVGHRVEPCILAADPSCYVTDGPDPFVVQDPDGDPIVSYAVGAAVAAGLPASKGVAALDLTGFRFRFETPTSAPAQFRGAGDATGFSLTASATDSFGAASNGSVPLQVRNRLPVLVEPVASVQVPHRYDAATRRYLATASGPRFEDPDGDPIGVVGGDVGFCSSVTLSSGRVLVGCERAWDYTLGGRPPLQSLIGPRYVSLLVGDGWGSVAATTVVEVLDRLATISAPVQSVEQCACVAATGCPRYTPATSAIPIPVQFEDPDGDPAELEVLVSGRVVPQPPAITCLPGWCYPRMNPVEANRTGGDGSVRAFTREWGMDDAAPFSVTTTCASAGTCCTP